VFVGFDGRDVDEQMKSLDMKASIENSKLEICTYHPRKFPTKYL
jgi:hypothetical protein